MHDPTDHTTVDVLKLDPNDYKRRLSVNLDVELIECLDARRGTVSRSDYVEQVLFAAMERLTPHLPDDWTPEKAAHATYERMSRHAQRPHGDRTRPGDRRAHPHGQDE